MNFVFFNLVYRFDILLFRESNQNLDRFKNDSKKMLEQREQIIDSQRVEIKDIQTQIQSLFLSSISKLFYFFLLKILN